MLFICLVSGRDGIERRCSGFRVHDLLQMLHVWLLPQLCISLWGWIRNACIWDEGNIRMFSFFYVILRGTLLLLLELSLRGIVSFGWKSARLQSLAYMYSGNMGMEKHVQTHKVQQCCKMSDLDSLSPFQGCDSDLIFVFEAFSLANTPLKIYI